MRRPGLEPGTPAWKADMLTPTPRTRLGGRGGTKMVLIVGQAVVSARESNQASRSCPESGNEFSMHDR